jgi:hypothetical protein
MLILEYGKKEVQLIMDQISRTYNIDGDTVVVNRIFDEEIGGYINNYPDFKLNPRKTPNGKYWVNATCNDCPFADTEYGDCGSCKYYLCESAGDLIGICTNEEKNANK